MPLCTVHFVSEKREVRHQSPGYTHNKHYKPYSTEVKHYRDSESQVAILI